MRFSGTAGFPGGSADVNRFSFFNAVAFQIVLGAPVILFAKSLGANSLVLGTIAALTPLLNILQLVAARFLHLTGYKRFVLAGWGARTFFTLGIAALPLWPGLSPETRLVLLIFALLCFNLLRGFTAGAWLPWLTALIPEPVRGRFLARDQAFMHVGCLAAMLVSALVMGGRAGAGQYSAVFAIGLLSALASLWFIRRIPEAHSPEELRRSGAAVPWGAILRYAPFARLLWFNTVFAAVIGSLGVFTVEFLVEREKFGEGTILLLGGLSFVGALAGLLWTGPRLDATGSKPWLRGALALLAAVVAGWLMLAAALVPAWTWWVGMLNFLGGVGGAVFGVANTRIVMGSVPEMGRNHFFALFTVITSLGLGGAPILWGVLLDALGALDATAFGLSVNRYSVYFCVLGLLAVWNRRLAVNLPEGAKLADVPPWSSEPRPVVPVE